jgi:acetate kinase
MRILVLNGGSSSFKCWFCEISDRALPAKAPQPLWTASVDWSRKLGSAQMQVQKTGGTFLSRTVEAGAPVHALRPVLEALWNGSARVVDSPSDIDVVGHRIVHGGPEHRESAPLTAEVRAAIAEQVEFAPSHNRFELEAIQTVDEVLGTGVLQVAGFDTAFHSTLSPAAYVYPGPYQWFERGVRRYGFHGMSHRYAARYAAEFVGASSRVITCHLGNGASLAAVRDGKSVDTTMGFTPLEGLMMGTRSGSIDPAILIYLIRHRGYGAEQLDHILNQESGLLGVSGLSGDMREILQAIDGGNERARLAFDVYAHRLVRELGGMLAVLGGLDALVFTGGVGEHCAPLRARVCEQLEFLGLRLDPSRNAKSETDSNIASADSRIPVLVVRAEEEWEIARDCYHLARANAAALAGETSSRPR